MKKMIKKPPDKTIEIKTLVLCENTDVLIVKSKLINPSKNLIIGNKTVLGKGFSAIFFEFKRKYYGIAKIYDRNRELTGFYGNINTPIKSLKMATNSQTFSWIYYIVLDEDEFEESVKKNWIDEKLAQKASKTLTQIINMVKNDEFPPKSVKEYANKCKV